MSCFGQCDAARRDDSTPSPHYHMFYVRAANAIAPSLNTPYTHHLSCTQYWQNHPVGHKRQIWKLVAGQVGHSPGPVPRLSRAVLSLGARVAPALNLLYLRHDRVGHVPNLVYYIRKLAAPLHNLHAKYLPQSNAEPRNLEMSRYKIVF